MNFFRAHIFFLSVLLLAYCASVAQGGWQREHYLAGSNTSECRDVIEAPNGNIIMSGVTVDSAGQKLTIVGADVQGNILWQKKYGSNKFFYLDNNMHLGGPVLKEGNYFYQALCARDSNNKYIGVLQKFDFNGDTIWQKIYRDSDTLEDVIPQGLCKSVDGGFLITGFFQNWSANPYRKTMVIKTDLNGNELWRKKIGKNPPDMVEVQDGKSIVQDTATKRIVIVGYQYLGGGAAVFGNVLILDSLGNKLVHTTYNNVNGDPFYQVIQLRDKNFLTCGSYNSLSSQSGNIRYYGFLAKFNISGGLIWYKTYDTLSRFQTIGQIHELSNGDIVMAGHIDTMLNYPHLGTGSRTRIQLFRLDANGNLKYKKYVGSVYKQYDNEQIRSMSPCQDGGYVLAAWNIFSPPPHPFNVIRVDSNFCDTLESWCKSVALDVDELGPDIFYKLDLFPNPAKEHVSIRYNTAYKYQSAFSVRLSDMSGRELENIEIQTQLEVQVNTSAYPAGVYFVSLVQNGKTVAKQKLLIIK